MNIKVIQAIHLYDLLKETRRELSRLENKLCDTTAQLTQEELKEYIRIIDEKEKIYSKQIR
jgi:hypothetical protein